jgi:hypothetical protein
MNEEFETAYKIRKVLNQGTEALPPGTAERLFQARNKALASHRQASVGVLGLAGLGHFSTDFFLHRARTVAAITALAIGAGGAYYWNNFQQADENEEIDSALLADDLPVNAYLDQGFHAWLERSAPSSPQP